ncbi:MAG: hypothetical protein ACTSWL_02560 [Promethearchaeota archaeon]
MVKTISRTKKQSSKMVWKNGYGLKGVDSLEANVDNFLDELTRRVQRTFSLDRIQYNFATSKLNLPSDIMNLFNVSPGGINHMIWKSPSKIGAISIDEHEEIWVLIGNRKYAMQADGKIHILNLD